MTAPNLSVGFLAQKLERAIRRAVVDDHDLVEQPTMMREEVREDVFFVPAGGVVVDRRVTTGDCRPAASSNSHHIQPTARVSKFAHCNSLWSKFYKWRGAFPGGELSWGFLLGPKDTTMPEVIVYAIAGRTAEQKKGLMKDITDAVVKNFGVKIEAVTVQIVESQKDSKAKAGVPFTER